MDLSVRLNLEDCYFLKVTFMVIFTGFLCVIPKAIFLPGVMNKKM